MEQREILVKSRLDSSMQPSLFYKSETSEKRPLLVGLHTWSHDRYNQINNMLPYAQKYDFNLLLPEFRGDNLKKILFALRLVVRFTQRCSLGALQQEQMISSGLSQDLRRLTSLMSTPYFFLMSGCNLCNSRLHV